jgi:hypothetical protein
MGMSTHVVGFIPPDSKFDEMKKIWDLCSASDVEIPTEVGDFFNWETPDAAGVEIDIEAFVSRDCGHECQDGWEIDLNILSNSHPHIKKIRFVNSY